MDGRRDDRAALTASIDPTANDFKRVYAWLFWHAPRRYPIAVLCVTLWLVAGDAWLRGHSAAAAAEAALVTLYLLIAVIQWSVVLPHRAWRSTCAQFPLRADFTPEGLTLTGPNSLVQSLWQSFERYIDARDFYLLVHPDKTFFMVPKASVERNRLDDLAALLAAHLPRKDSLPA
jgi:hypothetical protein